MNEDRFQALIPRALALVVSDALRDLSPAQEAIARADLREGGTASSDSLAALLELPLALVERERRAARRRILKRMRHLLSGGWSSLVLALRSTELTEATCAEVQRRSPGLPVDDSR